ncbi:sugar ABC transporter substrate-binding protein [Alicyclobacillus macrosporangiidus]|uniref:D-xylose transport system substrate-binding protein n=1 Tax=Alicyclobacillus macrosporangiidus TaxID=392015 RepID=A0A1I7GJ56_9BACL|nr:sugar ABC transporter substrate-binding protein [Alicyclobacillus macrosporangiidus]SFU48351.1 D-xylose transport system substrate-binding protein [Alicyclobacillus macrosporangiidus]
MFQRKTKATAMALLLALPLAVSACGQSGGNTGGSADNTAGTNTTGNNTGGSSSGGATIALLLPETATSARYETQDRPDFEQTVQQLAPNIKVIYNNAQGNATTQQQQAEAAITNGAKVLVLDPVDSKAAAAIVNEAQQAGVKVISYDRLITGANVDYYVSFDNEQVGRLQGQYIADHTPKGGTVVMINGAQTDNNALLFAKGAHDVLDPLFKNGTLKKGYETYTPDWLPANGQREMEQALTKLNNKVDGVLAANDGLAGAVIQALRAQGLAGKIPVTGQDATDAGLHNILQGLQSMTVYKAVKQEAEAAAKLAVALANGQQPEAGLVNGKVNNGAEDVPSVLLTPVVVTKDNIQDTVIKDGYTTMDKINAAKS